MNDPAGIQALALLPHGDAGGLALLGAVLLAGLVGGASHCVGMCGPFVVAQVAARLESVPAARMTELHRLTGAALLPYHLGRLTTYAGLGAVAGAIGGSISMIPGFGWVSAAWLLLAAAMFVVYGLSGAGALGSADGGEGSWAYAVSRGARPLFAQPTGLRGYVLGLMLGFLPCGLLYAALAVAAGAGGPWGGGVTMAAFALGTVPGLFLTGFAGHLAAGRWRRAARTLTPVLMAANAGVLGLAAWRLIA